MEIRRFTPDDRDALLGWVAVGNAVRRHDAPWEHDLTEDGARGLLTHDWDGEPDLPVLGLVDGEPVAAGGLGASDHDNLHLAWLTVQVVPTRRRRGLGRALLRHLESLAAERGRTTVGMVCWDLPEGVGSEGFGTRHGYRRRAVEVNRRQMLAEVDAATIDRMHAEAAAHAADYELVRWPGRSPDDELPAVAVMTGAINDAPTDDLDIEDEVYDAERVRAYEDAQLARGFAFHRLVVRHRRTGELAGQTVVVVDGERPHLAEQHDTSVVAAHRGHRLGALLKTGMLQWLREEQPQVAEIQTWNAESNSFMIGVNEALGYRVVGRELLLQRSLG